MLVGALTYFIALALAIAVGRAILAIVDSLLNVKPPVDELTDEPPTAQDLPRYRGRR